MLTLHDSLNCECLQSTDKAQQTAGVLELALSRKRKTPTCLTALAVCGAWAVSAETDTAEETNGASSWDVCASLHKQALRAERLNVRTDKKLISMCKPNGWRFPYVRPMATSSLRFGVVATATWRLLSYCLFR